jgi:hypothetical protein
MPKKHCKKPTKTAHQDYSIPEAMFPSEPDIVGALREDERHASKTAPLVKSGTREAALVKLLQRRRGATVFDMIDVTGWLPHTCRAALSRLRKKGYAIERIDDPKTGSTYRLLKEKGDKKS